MLNLLKLEIRGDIDELVSESNDWARTQLAPLFGSAGAVDNFLSEDVARFACLIFPRSSRELTRAMCDLGQYMVLLDSIGGDRSGLGRSAHATRYALGEVMAAFVGWGTVNEVTAPVRDAAQRLRAAMTPTQWERFTAGLEGYADGILLEAVTVENEQSRDLASYTERRRVTIGMRWPMAALESGAGYEINAYAAKDSRIEEMRVIALDHLWLVNDLMSFRKEMYAGEGEGVVPLLRRTESLTLQEAVHRVQDMISEREHAFIDKREEILSGELAEEAGVAGYLDGLGCLVAGSQAWCLSTARFHGADGSWDGRSAATVTLTPSGTTFEPLGWPLDRPAAEPFGIAASYQMLREKAPATRVSLPGGESALLVTTYQDVRTVLSDRRFSSLTRPLHRAGWEEGEARIGRLVHSDPPQHTHYRRLLTQAFSARRVSRLEPRIEQIVQEHLDAMADGPQPTDLIAAFALPVPLRITCEMMGIPYAERENFEYPNDRLLTRGLDAEEAASVTSQLLDYMLSVVARKRKALDDDLISEMIRAGTMTDNELADMAITLLLGGYETLTGMISASMLVLLENPGQQGALCGTPNERDRAVDELLRHITIIQYGLDRVATQDLVLSGQKIRAGDRVIAFLPAANRDPALCQSPDTLDTSRQGVAHASFGFGPHQCLGQQLGRVELRVALSGLFKRFPTIKIAVPASQLKFRDNLVVGGLHELPVSW
ncbi:cytochrome P450 [Streptomyces sp. NPDC051546]|uniref:cytochrome P450 n=1 Tax=Streptomyces sp. NPDC051546 TaxID=3365655 RepID=UPI0037B56A36